MQSRKRRNATLSQEDIPELIFKGKEKDTAVTGEITGACKRKIGQILGVNVFTAYSECNLTDDKPKDICIFSVEEQDKSKLKMLIYKNKHHEKRILPLMPTFKNTVELLKKSFVHASQWTITLGDGCYCINFPSGSAQSLKEVLIFCQAFASAERVKVFNETLNNVKEKLIFYSTGIFNAVAIPESKTSSVYAMSGMGDWFLSSIPVIPKEGLVREGTSYMIFSIADAFSGVTAEESLITVGKQNKRGGGICRFIEIDGQPNTMYMSRWKEDSDHPMSEENPTYFKFLKYLVESSGLFEHVNIEQIKARYNSANVRNDATFKLTLPLIDGPEKCKALKEKLVTLCQVTANHFSDVARIKSNYERNMATIIRNFSNYCKLHAKTLPPADTAKLAGFDTSSIFAALQYNEEKYADFFGAGHSDDPLADLPIPEASSSSSECTYRDDIHGVVRPKT